MSGSISPYEQQFVMDMVNLVIVITVVLSCVIALVFYIFQAIGLYHMSKNRGYRYPWLAFIPVAGDYVLGGIADNINVCYGRRSSWRIWVTVLSGLSLLSNVLTVTLSISWLYDMLESAFSGQFNEYYFLDQIYSFYGPLFFFTMLGSLVGLGYTIVSMINFYKIYQDYSRNAVLFLVLSLLFGIAPFFLFAIRNKPSASLAYRNQASGGYNSNPPQPPYVPQSPTYPPQYPQP